MRFNHKIWANSEIRTFALSKCGGGGGGAQTHLCPHFWKWGGTWAPPLPPPSPTPLHTVHVQRSIHVFIDSYVIISSCWPLHAARYGMMKNQYYIFLRINGDMLQEKIQCKCKKLLRLSCNEISAPGIEDSILVSFDNEARPCNIFDIGYRYQL